MLHLPDTLQTLLWRKGLSDNFHGEVVAVFLVLSFVPYFEKHPYKFSIIAHFESVNVGF